MAALGRLDEYLADHGHDGYLLDAGGADADQRYLSGFDAPDPFITLYTPGRLTVLVSELEFGRARRTDRIDAVHRHSDYDYADLRDEFGPDEARRRMIAAFLDRAGVGSVAVPLRFPLDTADTVRDAGIGVEPDRETVVSSMRAVKRDDEIAHIRATQEANEAAMAAAADLLREATPERGRLVLDAEPLTAERVKEAIEVTLLRHGCALDDTIVAGGDEGADPHERGSGPLPADEPVVVDIFPRNKATRYHADMTRTFVRGDPDPEMERRHRATLRAQEAAFAAIEPGVTGAAVHDAVCDVYEDAGYETLRSDPAAETGFIHGTGHGIGLEVHEAPRLAPGGGPLAPGNAVTVEPGLYDPDVGGIRVEDLVVVIGDGYENLTTYPTDLVI